MKRARKPNTDNTDLIGRHYRKPFSITTYVVEDVTEDDGVLNVINCHRPGVIQTEEAGDVRRWLCGFEKEG